MPEPNLQNRTLFHGDNLDFLRGVNSESVDVSVTGFVLNICYYPDQAVSQVEMFAKEIMPQWR